MDTTSVTDYIDLEDPACLCWPMICIHCGSAAVFYSDNKDDALCHTCGRWQLKDPDDAP